MRNRWQVDVASPTNKGNHKSTGYMTTKNKALHCAAISIPSLPYTDLPNKEVHSYQKQYCLHPKTHQTSPNSTNLNGPAPSSPHHTHASIHNLHLRPNNNPRHNNVHHALRPATSNAHAPLPPFHPAPHLAAPHPPPRSPPNLVSRTPTHLANRASKKDGT
jgi:hypothetical protein